MKLQISFDILDLEKSIAAAHELETYTDIIEIGPLLIYKYGEQAIAHFRTNFPQKTILVNMKIADKGKESVRIAINSGADIITVLAGTNHHVIHAACSTAHDLGKKIMLDLIDASSLGQSALEAYTLGVNYLLFHYFKGSQQTLSLQEQWDMIKGNTKLPIFITKNITLDTIQEILALNPDGIILSKNSERDLIKDEVKYIHELCKNISNT